MLWFAFGYEGEWKQLPCFFHDAICFRFMQDVHRKHESPLDEGRFHGVTAVGTMNDGVEVEWIYLAFHFLTTVLT